MILSPKQCYPKEPGLSGFSSEASFGLSYQGLALWGNTEMGIRITLTLEGFYKEQLSKSISSAHPCARHTVRAQKCYHSGDNDQVHKTLSGRTRPLWLFLQDFFWAQLPRTGFS